MMLKVFMFSLWGVVGLALAIASSQCQWVDPVLPSICLGTLIGFLLYTFLGQERQSSAAEGTLLGWKFTVNGAIVVVGLVSALIWTALSNGRACVGDIDLRLYKKGNDSELIAETSSSPGKIVGFVKDKTFESQSFRDFVNDDFFHPALIQMRSNLCPGAIPECFRGASFRMMLLPSQHIKADDVIEVCTDTAIGSKAQELQDVLRNGASLAAMPEGVEQQANEITPPQPFRMIEAPHRCRPKASRFKEGLAGSNSAPVRIFALTSPNGFRRLTGSTSIDKPKIITVSLDVQSASKS
jgi:hypothetical protein